MNSLLASASHPVQRFVACRTCRQLERITPDLSHEDEEPFVVRGHRLYRSASVGVALVSNHFRAREQG